MYDGCMSVQDVANECIRTKQAGCAITDHGTITGVPNFVRTFNASGLKAVAGCEFYIKAYGLVGHITLLARNQSGWRSIIELHNLAHQNFYRKPLLLPEHLDQPDIICLSGCLASIHAQLLLTGRKDEARQWLSYLHKVYGEHLYLELQPHNLVEQRQLNEFLLEQDLSCVATTDSHHTCNGYKEYAYMLEQKTAFENIDRLRLPFGTYAQCMELPKESIELSHEILEYCSTPAIDTKKHYFPGIENRDDKINAMLEYARARTKDSYKEKLEYEIEVVTKGGYLEYFYVLWDCKKWCDAQKILWGYGRGSAAGSLLSYMLGITGIDPIEHQLYFERFLNPDRVSLPDVDIDIEHTRREDVLEYLRSKWGNVHGITTLFRTKFRTAVRDVYRALGYPITEADRVAKLLPRPVQGKEQPDDVHIGVLRDAGIDEKIIARIINLSGKPRAASQHAAGTVIVSDYMPKPPVTKDNVIAWEMGDVEKAGYIKYDFLGLKTLSVVSKLRAKIAMPTGGFHPKVAELLASGRLHGVFQLEASGIAKYCSRFQPKNIEDLSDVLALYRPGPLDAGIAEEVLARRNGLKGDGQPILIYQEQVMQIARDKAGYSMAEADMLRKAIGKKNPEELAKHKDRFEPELWKRIETFGAYGFNKAHSMAYAYLAYETAYYKALYPLDFYEAYLNVYTDKYDISLAILNAKYLGLKIIYPRNFDDWETKREKNTLVLGLNLFKGNKKKPLKPGKIVKETLSVVEGSSQLEIIKRLGCSLVSPIKRGMLCVHSEKNTGKESNRDYWKGIFDTGSSVIEKVSNEPLEVGDIWL